MAHVRMLRQIHCFMSFNPCLSITCCRAAIPPSCPHQSSQKSGSCQLRAQWHQQEDLPGSWTKTKLRSSTYLVEGPRHTATRRGLESGSNDSFKGDLTLAPIGIEKKIRNMLWSCYCPVFSHSFPQKIVSFPWFSHSFPQKIVSFPWFSQSFPPKKTLRNWWVSLRNNALGPGAGPGLSEGGAEGVGQLLGESETAGHEGVDHDHVPWFRYIDSDIVWYSSEMWYLQIFFRYSSDIVHPAW